MSMQSVALAILGLGNISVMLRSRWSVRSLSVVTSFTMVAAASSMVLANFNDVENRLYPPGAAPAPAFPPAPGPNRPAPSGAIPGEYDDTFDTLYTLGLGCMSLGSLGIYPMWSRTAWTPYLVPLIYLVVAGAYPQPLERFLQVSLSHVLLLLQVGAGAGAGVGAGGGALVREGSEGGRGHEWFSVRVRVSTPPRRTPRW